MKTQLFGASSNPRWTAARLAAIAADHGTPVYAYDLTQVVERIGRVRAAFGPVAGSAGHACDVALLYAAKANPYPSLLEAMRPYVDGLDVASLGEVEAAVAAGYPPPSLRLAGPGKTFSLLRRAVKDQLLVSVESPEELTDLTNLAREEGRSARVVLRLEPRTALHAFAVTMASVPMRPRSSLVESSTGSSVHPFGLDEAETEAALAILDTARDALTLEGIHVYRGAQCRSVRGWLNHLAEVLDLAETIQRRGWPLRDINLGGGFGVASSAGPELDVEALGPKASRMLGKFRENQARRGTAEAPPDRTNGEPASVRRQGSANPRFVLELGRFLVADAGVFVTRVLRTKVRAEHRVAVLDGGVHQLWAATGQLGPRPRAVRVPLPSAAALRSDGVELSDTPTHLMGPLCTPLDALGTIPGAVRPGDLVAFLQVGAYGATLSPTAFLGHGPAREVLLRDTTAGPPGPPER